MPDRIDRSPDPWGKPSPVRTPKRDQPQQTTMGSTKPQHRTRLHIHSSTTPQAIASGGSGDIVTFNTADYNSAGLWASNKFTVPNVGKITEVWQLHGYATWASAAGGTVRELRWRKNGTTVVRTSKVGPSLLITLDPWIEINDPIGGDYYELVAFQDSGAPINLLKSPEEAAVEIIHLW